MEQQKRHTLADGPLLPPAASGRLVEVEEQVVHALEAVVPRELGALDYAEVVGVTPKEVNLLRVKLLIADLASQGWSGFPSADMKQMQFLLGHLDPSGVLRDSILLRFRNRFLPVLVLRFFIAFAFITIAPD
ncbi:hypothetical protein DL768_004828 [Monosporascus sp. mg162]|nr:hypothetical protein DL768_004828 [Monosporascus sp. mg162]